MFIAISRSGIKMGCFESDQGMDGSGFVLHSMIPFDLEVVKWYGKDEAYNKAYKLFTSLWMYETDDVVHIYGTIDSESFSVTICKNGTVRDARATDRELFAAFLK